MAFWVGGGDTRVPNDHPEPSGRDLWVGGGDTRVPNDHPECSRVRPLSGDRTGTLESFVEKPDERRLGARLRADSEPTQLEDSVPAGAPSAPASREVTSRASSTPARPAASTKATLVPGSILREPSAMAVQ